MSTATPAAVDLTAEPMRSRRNHWNTQVRRHALMKPDAPALRFLGNETSWRRLDERTRAFAAALHRRGVKFGDRIMILMLNRSEYVEAVLSYDRGMDCLPPWMIVVSMMSPHCGS